MVISLADFFFNTPLYTAISIKEDNLILFNKVFDSNNFKEFFEGYNPRRRIESTFEVLHEGPQVQSTMFFRTGGHKVVQVRCKRSDELFQYLLYWDLENESLQKIGQYPSVAEFHIFEVKKYCKVLPKEKLTELTRAIGLAAHGVGIGSFAYLRRIFEYLVASAYDSCLHDEEITEEVFRNARMEQKIDLLSAHLPPFLVSNKAIYSVLSLGIHELDEDTCLAHFDTLRVGIELILDEKLEELRKTEKTEAAKKSRNTLAV